MVGMELNEMVVENSSELGQCQKLKPMRAGPSHDLPWLVACFGKVQAHPLCKDQGMLQCDRSLKEMQRRQPQPGNMQHHAAILSFLKCDKLHNSHRLTNEVSLLLCSYTPASITKKLGANGRFFIMPCPKSTRGLKGCYAKVLKDPPEVAQGTRCPHHCQWTNIGVSQHFRERMIP